MGRKWGGAMPELSVAALVLLGLGLAGWAYDRWVVGPLEARHGGHPFTAGLVIGGVLLTLAGGAVLVGVVDALWVLACFAASGLMVTVGAARRFLAQREGERQAGEMDVLEQLERIGYGDEA